MDTTADDASDDWGDATPPGREGPAFAGEGFLVDLDVYEGPLDLLLELVQKRKIDVALVSVLAVVEQFLAWIRTAIDARLETAADWLLMAATLAFLKSRLLLPVGREERTQAEVVVEDFVSRLRRMQAMRDFAESLAARPRLGLQWHEPRDPEGDAKGPNKRLETTLYAMLASYVAEARVTLMPAPVPVRLPHVTLSLEDALRMVEAACARSADWTSILDALPAEVPVDAVHARSRVASTYVASLELAKRGLVDVEQAGRVVRFRPRRDEAA